MRETMVFPKSPFVHRVGLLCKPVIALLAIIASLSLAAFAQTKPPAAAPKKPATVRKAPVRKAPARPRVQTAPTRERII